MASIWNDTVRRGVVSSASAVLATEPLQGKRCYRPHAGAVVMCVKGGLHETMLQAPGHRVVSDASPLWVTPMPIGRLSIRSQPGNRLHHLYRNNGDVWWVHYTLNWDGRTRRIRRSLDTKCVEEAIRLRDELFARIEREGEPVPERRSLPTFLPLRLGLPRIAGSFFARVAAFWAHDTKQSADIFREEDKKQ